MGEAVSSKSDSITTNVQSFML